MTGQRDLERTVRDGERNAEVKQLIHNWCRHARVENMGGTGLVQAVFNVPVGHHAMVCDFAPASGLASYYLEESAVRFHDANCVGCPHRIPVTFPNLTQLISKRDQARQQRREKAERDEQDKQAALEARRAARAHLRAALPHLAQSFLDELDRLDAERSTEATTRLVQSAQLAPEILAPELVEYLFAVLESDETWLDRAALTILANTPDQSRLVRAALRCLTEGHALELAATTVAARLDFVDPTQLVDAVIGLAFVAVPPRSDFGRPSERVVLTDPLLQVAARFPDAVQRGLRSQIGRREPLRVGAAARAMGLLVATDDHWVSGFLRPLASVLSRTDVSVDFERESTLTPLVHDLRQAVAQAFVAFPDLADSELMRQFESASAAGEDRLAGAYEHVLRLAGPNRFEPDKTLAITPTHLRAFAVAITRLTSLASTSDNGEVTQHVLSAFRHPDPSLNPVAVELLDLLLGTAAVLDSKWQDPEPEPTVLSPPHPLAALEKSNRRSRLWYLRSALLEFAMAGVRSDAKALVRFEAFLAQRGLLGDSFEAALVREIAPLLDTNAGLQAMLPYLYGAMVGPSVGGRAAAANALKEIGAGRFDELPGLVAETLYFMLFDPYKMVHKSAVETLGRVRLPPRFRRHVAIALDNLIAAYRGEADEAEFLFACIEARARSHGGEGELPEADARVLLALLAELDPSVLLRSGHQYLLRSLAHLDEAPPLVLGLVAHCQQDYELEHALELVADLPVGAGGKHLPAVLKAMATAPDDVMMTSTFVELLTRDRAWQGANELTQLHAAAFADTRRERVRKIYAEQLERRTRFEMLLGQGQVDEALAVGEQWRAADAELTQLTRRDDEPFEPFG